MPSASDAVVSDRHRERGVGREVRDVSDRGADRGKPGRRGLEHDDAARLVPGRKDEEMRPAVEGRELVLGTNPWNVTRESRPSAEASRCTAPPSVSSPTTSSRHRAPGEDAAERAEQGRLVLHAVEAGDVEEPPRRPVGGLARLEAAVRRRAGRASTRSPRATASSAIERLAAVIRAARPRAAGPSASLGHPARAVPASGRPRARRRRDSRREARRGARRSAHRGSPEAPPRTRARRRTDPRRRARRGNAPRLGSARRRGPAWRPGRAPWRREADSTRERRPARARRRAPRAGARAAR